MIIYLISINFQKNPNEKFCKSAAFPLVQTKIIDFFRIKRSPDSSQISSSSSGMSFCRFEVKILNNLCFVLGNVYLKSEMFADSIGKKRKKTSLVMSKKKRRLLPYNPTNDPQRRLEQMASLATALRASNTKFSNELTYVSGKAPRSANQAGLEKGGMQVFILSRYELLLFFSYIH